MSTNQTISTSGILSAGGVLDEIVAAKTKRLNDLKRKEPLDELIARAQMIIETAERRSLREALSTPDRINIIAEVKRRSPSKGILRENFDATSIARSYEMSGAAAISILAEEDYFGGSLEDLKAARKLVRLPLLRKDFLFDEYQLYEAKAGGADAVLLIVALLDGRLLSRLITLAGELKLDALVEVHTRDEMNRAREAGAEIIGINNRDLTTFKVDLATSVELAEVAPAGSVLVSESGIASGADIRRLKAAGFDAFLIGELFMRACDPGRKLEELLKEDGFDLRNQ